MYRLPVYFLSYGARINQQFDLLQLQRLSRKIHRSRTVQIRHSLVTRSVSRYALSALWQLVAGSIFLAGKKRKKNFQKNGPATYPWASSASVINPANTYYVFAFCSHIRLPAQSDVACSIFSFFYGHFFSVQKNEPAWCHRARPMCLS